MAARLEQCLSKFVLCGSLLLQLAITPCGSTSIKNPPSAGARVEAEPPPAQTSWDTPLPYYGSSVTAARVMMNASHVTQYDGLDRDDIIVDIIAQGPVHWSISHFDRGDLSPRLQPRRPFAQPNLAVVANKGFNAQDPKDHSVQAWKPDVKKGVLLASVAQNGQQWDDGTPRFYGTVACVARSDGYGYSMADGKFSAGDSIDVTVGKAGKMGEGNIDVALAWFPYDQGWVAGYLDKPFDSAEAGGEGGQLAARQHQFRHGYPRWVVEGAHSPSLPADATKVLIWRRRNCYLMLPGVDSERDGMLFVTSTDPGSDNDDVNAVSVYWKQRRTGNQGGWRVTQREDSESVSSPKKNVERDQYMFAFVYIPYTAGGLIGGTIDGRQGKVIRGAGQFQCKRVGEGQYEIRVGGAGRPGAPDGDSHGGGGVLLLQTAGRDLEVWKVGSTAILSYNYTDRGTLLVEARKLFNTTGGGEELRLQDSDFYFAWVDFRNPLTPTADAYTGAPAGRAGPGGGVSWGGLFWWALALLACLGSAYGGMLFWAHRQHRLFALGPFGRDGGEDPQGLGTDLLGGGYKF